MKEKKEETIEETMKEKKKEETEEEKEAMEETVGKAMEEAMENEVPERGAPKEEEPVEEIEIEEAAEAGEDAAEAEESGGPAEEEAGDGKMGFFKKKKDKKDEQIEELTDKLKRQMAEFDNFRKRTEKEKAQMYDMGAKSIIEKILPVIDNFERGLAGVPEEERENAFVVGMDKTYRQMLTELENAKVTPIEAVGKEFDPVYHNAVMQVENEEYGSGIVAQELQKGYMYKDSVIRHSMVAVVS